MASMIRNLRFTLRMLRKSPGFTATVVLTLALGVGAVTAIYTAVYATLLAPMPYPHPDQLVMVWSKVQGDRNIVSGGDFLDWQAQSSAFQELKAFDGTSFNLADKEEPLKVPGEYTSPGMYQMRGVPFQLGRDFLPEEGVAGKEHVVILMNKLWRRLGADPKIIGKTITLDQHPYTIVGVLAPGLADRLDPDLDVPLVFSPQQKNHDFHWLLVMGRLKPGVTIRQAQADMDAITARIAAANPRSNRGWGASVEPLQNDFIPDTTKLTLWLLLGSVGCLLLIACVNVANLLLARGTARQREIAVRASLGATRRDIFIQFIIESLLLALVGGLAGVGLGYAMLRGFVALLPPDTIPSEAELSLNLPVLIVALASTTLAGLLFGSAPAWYASRLDPVEALKEGGRAGAGRGRNRLRQSLVVAEFSLALALLAGAGLAMRSFWNLAHVDLGVHTEHVLTFGLPMNKGMDFNTAQVGAYYQQILRSIQSTTGVESAAASTGLPLAGAYFDRAFTIADHPTSSDRSQWPDAMLQMVTPDYFKTYGIRLLRGRSFTEADNASSLHVAMVNEQFVQRYLRGEDPIGQRLMLEHMTPGEETLGQPEPWVIVGVYHNVRGGAFRRQREEMVVPFYQAPWTDAEFGVRTAGDSAAMAKTIAAAVHETDPTIALARVETLDQVRDDALARDRFSLLLYAAFAVIALTLAAVGIYGVMAFAVGQREHEIGVRMALGASRTNVVRMILAEGAALSGTGLVMGLVGAYFMGRAMQSTLYNVGSVDLGAFCAVGALLMVAALLASYLPARRAAQVEPMQALRTE